MNNDKLQNPFTLYTGKDERTEGESRRLQVRTSILIGIFAAILLAFVGVLYGLQVVNGGSYLANATATVAQKETVDTHRGEITDRYGRVLVTNEICYNVTLNTDLMGTGRNDILRELIALARDSGVQWTDSLPISRSAPWQYTRAENIFVTRSTDDDGQPVITGTTFLGALSKQYKWISNPATASLSAEELLVAMCKSFGLIDKKAEEPVITEEMRALAGVLYELSLRSAGILHTEYLFASDVDIAFISRVKEHALTGVVVETASTRAYTTSSAPHVLGLVGNIYAEEWATYRDLGYSMDATVGKSGIEAAFESVLRGESGIREVETDENGKIITQNWLTEPAPGENVVLTLDIALQATTEELLANFVQSLDTPDGAAAVVLDMTGGVLALASYPTFDLNTYYEDYTELSQSEVSPYYNRATNGLYAPGSTFKMVTAAAALGEGVISPRDTVLCTGQYTFYSYAGYTPRCWIYPGNHASETVSEAIKDSCNIFFYDVGRRTGIEAIVAYATKFGLGQKTGIEIGEYKGTVAGPEAAAANGLQWYGGDTLPAAIGQGANQFTPLQLANYVATLVNGGNHYEVHLLKEIKSSDYSRVVSTYEPVLKDTLQLADNHLEAIKRGMYDLSKTASLAKYFSSLPVEVGCKTGTAEVNGKEPTAVFVCFAPYDDPQIAICLVAEQGVSGSTLSSDLASVAAGILDQYFSTGSGLTAPDGENVLIP